VTPSGRLLAQTVARDMSAAHLRAKPLTLVDRCLEQGTAPLGDDVKGE